MFPLDLIVLGLDIQNLGCAPRDPSVAWQNWKTIELQSSGNFDPGGVQKVIERRKNLVENFPVPRVSAWIGCRNIASLIGSARSTSG